MVLGILLFVLALLIIVMIHEAGHFTVAKIFDFKAPKFFVGFGPTLWSFKRGETEYGIKALPVGGFIKIVGMNPYEEVAPEDRARSYPNKPRWQRALLLMGGPVTHWPLAFLIWVIAGMAVGFPAGATTTVEEVQGISIDGEEIVDSPAIVEGLRAGDTIVAAGGRPTETWADVTRYIDRQNDYDGTFTVERDGTTRVLDVELAQVIRDRDEAIVAYAPPGEEVREPGPDEEVTPFLGIRPTVRYERLGLIDASGQAASAVGEATVQAVALMPKIFAPVFNGDLWDYITGARERDPENSPVGIIGIGRIAGETFREGLLLDFFGLVFYFSILVGVLNLLPLPPLDGGHLAVVGIEAITRRSIDMRKVIPVAAAVISFLLILTLAMLYLDLANPIELPL